MAWLKAITLLLSLANMIANYLSNAQMIKQGEAQAILKGIADADKAIKKANAARNNVDPDGGMLDDPDNRDK